MPFFHSQLTGFLNFQEMKKICFNNNEEKEKRERKKNAMKLKNDAKFFRVRSTLSYLYTYIGHKKRGETQPVLVSIIYAV